jgi:sarcosine oxidase subunit beta
VTLEDVQHAIAKGYRDVESIKRYRLRHRPLPGKSCLAAVAQTLHTQGGMAPAAVLPFTPRPPLHPVELSLLASVPVADELAPKGGVPPSLESGSHALRPATPVPERPGVVIVGGGIMGLALAHNLAKLGLNDVVVLERGYLCAGASGRNGGGVRMQWGTATNIELARRSIELMKQFAGEMGINIWLRQGGYLFLAKSDKVADQLRRTADLHNQHGVMTQVLSPGEGRDVVKHLTMEGVILCAYHPDDGVIFPWPFLWGYAQAAQKRGVRVETFTTVTGFEVSGGLIRAVQTDRGRIGCDTVVVAAGAWSPEVAAGRRAVAQRAAPARDPPPSR